MLGAQVEIVIAKDKVLWRRARTDGSYLSAHDPRVLAGLGSAARVDAVRVHWPDGRIGEWKNLSADRYVTLKEDSATNSK